MKDLDGLGGDSSKKNRAVLYCRVSTEDQAKEGFSLGAQKERLKAYCMAKGWKVIGTFVDDGYSGRSIERPAYLEMMEKMEEWDILVVLKMDRIHRNSKNFTLMMERLKENSKEFTSMQESFDTTTAMGRFVMDIIQRIAQLESEQIGERVYLGMLQKAKEGNGILGFNIPYGFDILKGKVVQKENEAIWVKKMYDLYRKGHSLSMIAHELETRKVRTKMGKTKWGKKTIARILSNPMNCGFLHWEGVIYQGDFIPIVNVETFNGVQKRMKGEEGHFIKESETRIKVKEAA